ncbi:alpha/beta fold hydrolase [Duganella rivi]|uniref:alpha/beta hydrolase n=1 Tax=Duganella aquatilis TaxID=2666082 RepID=UPI001AA05019
MQQLGYDKVDIVGHDIGSMVAFSFAANYPQATRRLVMVDVAHPDAALAKWPLLPEDLLEGRIGLEQAWMFRYLMQDESKLDALDRAVYRHAYTSRDTIRAGDAWYQAFPQDILDDGTYAPLEMPVLAVGGPGYGWLKSTLAAKSSNHRVVKIADSSCSGI